ncbi:protein-disulfide isomerase [Leptospira langatensis]|uniref:Protein-disulfide isomerase n=1 Tax=Leptospira langatensis TaxID=2484983 RepID=A0A5F1ZU13_9LEPT|nr:thioredoxin domain-containing protein [Leptospira langatensis]TGK03184.1 protein-disulfide isomerase [Leptospira langatensis]TGL41940.1 protein-disulfide isomerase [Leptospira langatensis]
MKKLPSNYILAVVSAVAAFISFLLIRKFFGGQAGDGVAQAICDALSDSGSCDKVSESSISAIRGVPIFGDIPIALFGFVFYGFITYLFVRSELNKEGAKGYLLFSFYLLLLALVVDVVLFSISVFYIDAICGLCAVTWTCTVLLTAGTFLQIRDFGDKSPKIIPSVLKTEGLNVYIAILALLVVGQIGGKSLNNSLVEGEHGGLSQIQKQLADYEKAPLLAIDTKGASFQGDPNAPITIVKYADFNCGHCMHTSHILKKVLRDYDGIVKVVYKNFPLDASCNRLVQAPRPEASSCVAASAAICADKQKKFAIMYDDLYKDTENQVMHTPSTVLSLAQQEGLDMNQFRSCLSSPAVRDQINKEVDEADKLQIHSTPSLFINNKAIQSGTPNEQFLRALIESLIKKV